MTILEAIEQRHSVRQYKEKPIEAELVTKLNTEIEAINKESGLHIQMFLNEPEAFQANKTSYGQFSGCRNYFAIVGKKGMDEEVDYYGQKLVLFAQQLGLNTCWVAMTYKKGKVTPQIGGGEKLYINTLSVYVHYKLFNSFHIGRAGEGSMRSCVLQFS